MPKLEPLAVVALLQDVPEHGLERGQVGTIVDILSPTAAEVEFVDNNGHTYALATLPAAVLMRLRHEPLRHAA
jgi:hypothetical protein